MGRTGTGRGMYCDLPDGTFPSESTQMKWNRESLNGPLRELDSAGVHPWSGGGRLSGGDLGALGLGSLQELSAALPMVAVGPPGTLGPASPPGAFSKVGEGSLPQPGPIPHTPHSLGMDPTTCCCSKELHKLRAKLEGQLTCDTQGPSWSH